MTPLFSKKFLMVGIITITLPFGGGYTISTLGVTGSGATVIQDQNPTIVNAVVGSNTSYNWSGYQATGGTFTAVSGAWTIPAVPSAISTEADATWVGIGGVSSRDLIQVGTQAVINGSGAPAYQAWYEVLPETTMQLPLTVSPGDSISVSLTETAAAAGTTLAEWSISIRDNTTGQSYQTSIAYNSLLSSAEWIEEMPSDGSNFVPLDNFGSIVFTGGMTTENGVTQTISGAGAKELTMVNRAGQILASPSSIGGDSESFTVTRSTATAAVTGFGFGGNDLGRGWRRTGVGIQGFIPRPNPSSSVSSSGSATSGFGFAAGNPWNQFYRIIQQLQQLQKSQQFRGNYLRNSFKKKR